MTSRANPRKARSASTTSVVRRAREIADTSDRWFLSFAGGLGKLGDWALREADIAADSAAVAFTTTVGVAKKLTGLEGRRALGRPRTRDESESAEVDPEPAEPRAPETQAAGVDLVTAVPTVAWTAAKRRRRRNGEDAAPGVAGHPAGVVPLLQALGRTVADHTQRGYATLEEDERFWTLIHLLQLLSRPIVPPRFASAPEVHSGESPEADRSSGSLSSRSPSERERKP